MWGLNFFLGIPHWVIYCSWTIHQKIYLCGVSWWLSRVRIWCCHWSSLDHCCGVGWIPDLGTSTGCRLSKKKKKKEKKKEKEDKKKKKKEKETSQKICKGHQHQWAACAGAPSPLPSPDDSPPEQCMHSTENEYNGQKMALPLHNVPPEPTPLLHPLPSLSSYQSPQTTTLAAGGKHRESQARKAAAEVQKWLWACG